MNKKTFVSAEELRHVFHDQTKRRRLPSWQLISASILIVVGIYSLINAPALSQQLGYWWESDIKAGQQTSLESNKTQVTSNKNQEPVEQSTTELVNQLTNNSIYIPKTHTKAPIIWDVSGGHDLNSDMLTALQYGVVRYPQTALPNQIGNVFLTGHSSNYWWDKGHYKTVFALLNRLVVGDLVYVKFNGQLYTYRVTGQKVVKPTETSVLAATKTPTLSLMTCTPTGTSLLRRIVTASLISPTQGLSQQPTSPVANGLTTIR